MSWLQELSDYTCSRIPELVLHRLDYQPTQTEVTVKTTCCFFISRLKKPILAQQSLPFSGFALK